MSLPSAAWKVATAGEKFSICVGRVFIVVAVLFAAIWFIEFIAAGAWCYFNDDCHALLHAARIA